MTLMNSGLMESKVAARLIDMKKTLAAAESCSGGLLAHRLTNIPGSSAFFKLGLVTYSNESKTSLLKIPKPVIKQYGAVSQQVATLMSQQIRKLYKTDYGIAISGIAGPGGGTKTKPVGLTYIAVSSSAEDLCLECRFKGSRLDIKKKATSKALKTFLDFI